MSGSSASSGAAEPTPKTWSRRLRLRELALAFGGLFLTLLAIELALRARERFKPRRAPLGAYFQHDPLLGWSHRPGTQLRVGFPEAAVAVAINSRGLRDPERADTPAGGVSRILALGDSFPFGWAIADEQGVARVLESRLRRSNPACEVVNAGVSGYATDQELLLYRRVGRELRARLVLLFFYSNDVVYNARDNYWRGAKPFFTAEGEELVLRNVPVPDRSISAPADLGYGEGGRSDLGSFVRGRLGQALPGVHGFLAWFGLWPPIAPQAPPDERRVFERRPPPFVEESWSMTARLIRQLRDDVTADGARLALVYVPDRIEIADRSWRLACLRYGWTSSSAELGAVRARVARISSELGLPLVDLHDGLRRIDRGVLGGPYFPNGIHWNAAGHRAAAETIAQALLDGGMLP